jgi:uncharacterized MAPEG superfamily protein
MMQPTIAHWIVLVGGLLPIFAVAIAKSTRSYDNADPRNPAGYLDPLRKRAYAAHANSYEAFPFFAIAVLLATLRAVPPAHVDLAASIWLAFRLLYIACYLTDRASLRSVTWFGAFFAALAIYLMALI